MLPNRRRRHTAPSRAAITTAPKRSSARKCSKRSMRQRRSCSIRAVRWCRCSQPSTRCCCASAPFAPSMPRGRKTRRSSVGTKGSGRPSAKTLPSILRRCTITRNFFMSIITLHARSRSGKCWRQDIPIPRARRTNGRRLGFGICWALFAPQ